MLASAVASRSVVQAYIGVGGNLGDPIRSIRWAHDTLVARSDMREVLCSPLYRSAPVDAAGPDFVNAVFAISTLLGCMDLLSLLQKMEQEAGRVRSYQNAPRPLDLDLLLYGDATIDAPSLTVPHPRMAERAFVLRPLADLAPERVPDCNQLRVSAQLCERLTA